VVPARTVSSAVCELPSGSRTGTISLSNPPLAAAAAARAWDRAE